MARIMRGGVDVKHKIATKMSAGGTACFSTVHVVGPAYLRQGSPGISAWGGYQRGGRFTTKVGMECRKDEFVG